MALLAAVAPASARAEPQAFALRAEPTLAADAWTDNLLDGFRLAFWAKERGLAALEREPSEAHPLPLALSRVAELALIDIPIASYATVIPHEVFGHGGRLRELGSGADYTFRWPPPYGFTPSTTRARDLSVLSQPDADLLMTQGGIAVEAYEARQLLRSAFAADASTRFDTGLVVGIRLHEIFEATLPFGNNDVRHWTAVQARVAGVAVPTIQRRYLYSTIVAALLDPSFAYSAYDSFWRFLVHGHRGGALPSLAVGPLQLLVRPQVTPVPWGLEYELLAVARWSDAQLEAGPHLGIDPAARVATGGLAIAARLPIAAHWLGAAGVDAWVQPALTLAGPVVLGAPPPPPERKPGAKAFVDVAWRPALWFVGARLIVKTDGLSELSRYAAGVEGFVYAGIAP